MKRPDRHWVMGDGGWQSHDRSRCDKKSDCQRILCPQVPSHDEDGNERPWRLRDISLMVPAPRIGGAP